MNFKFKPGEDVKVSLFDLDYTGRVNRAMLTRNGQVYEIQYAQDGQLKYGDFYEDELRKS